MSHSRCKPEPVPPALEPATPPGTEAMAHLHPGLSQLAYCFGGRWLHCGANFPKGSIDENSCPRRRHWRGRDAGVSTLAIRNLYVRVNLLRSVTASCWDRLEAHIEAALSGWSLTPVVEALQALRGLALVAAATLVAELGDVPHFRKSPTIHGLSRSRSFRTLQRKHATPWRDHQGGTGRGAAHVRSRRHGATDFRRGSVAISFCARKSCPNRSVT